ncbi:MAG TPA: nitrilase-related carbon-nitrogen hydrolase [Vicinamibacteria bacterium]|nr:nitrilase-related carbon-nitrogen hydrolase [Vicinamibacteria bacterium]
MMRDVRVAAVQMESAAGDKDANVRKVARFAEEAAGRGVEVLLTPECGLTGYWFLRRLTVAQLRDLAEPVPEGRSCARLLELAARHRLTVGAGLVEAAGGDVFHNTYVVAMPDGRVVRHRKLHAFEHPAISAGSEHTVFDTPHGFRAALLICYDNNIVENVRVAALRGAEVLLAPHQTGGCRTTNPHLMGLVERRLWDERHEHPEAIEAELRGDKGRGWLMRWLPSRAHDNALFLVFSNGVGVDDDEIRTGNAMVLDPYGRILAETEKTDDDMVVADLDASLLEKATGRLWMKARRPDLYRELCVPTGLERDTHELKYEE